MLSSLVVTPKKLGVKNYRWSSSANFTSFMYFRAQLKKNMINKSCSTEYSVQFLKHLYVNKTIAQINTGFNRI